MKYLLALLMLPLACFAQNGREISYHKDNGFTTVRDSADYMEIIQPDSASAFFNITQYYFNGVVKFKGMSTKPSVAYLQSKATSYFANGNKKAEAYYDKGHIIGDQQLYFPNGKPYFVVEYTPDTLSRSENIFSGKPHLIKACYDSLGSALTVNGNGYFKAYDDLFKYVVEEGTIKNGKREGAWRASADTNRTSLAEVYSDGVLLSGKAIYVDGSTSTYSQKREVWPAYRGGIENLTDIWLQQYAIRRRTFESVFKVGYLFLS